MDTEKLLALVKKFEELDTNAIAIIEKLIQSPPETLPQFLQPLAPHLDEVKMILQLFQWVAQVIELFTAESPENK